MLDSFLRGATNAGTLGFNDEILGAALAPILKLTRPDLFNKDSISDVYKQARDTVRQQDNQAASNNPYANIFGNIGGAGVLAGPINNLKQAATLGTLYGGGYGLGSNTDNSPFGILSDIATNAAAGGLLGAGGYGAGQKIMQLLKFQKPAIPEFKPLAEIPGNQYLTNDEYTKIRNLNLNPDTRQQALNELDIASLKNEKHYKDWEARLYQNLPDFGKNIIKSLTYPRRKDTAIEQGLFDRDLNRRMESIKDLSLQQKEKIKGQPYNFQIPIRGDIDPNDINQKYLSKILKNKVESGDTVELFIDSSGGDSRFASKIYRNLAKSPAQIKVIIPKEGSSSAKQIADISPLKDAGYKSYIVEHLPVLSDSKNSLPLGFIEENIPGWQDIIKQHYIKMGLDKSLGPGRWEDFLQGQDLQISGPIYKNMSPLSRDPIQDDQLSKTLRMLDRVFSKLSWD